MGLKISLRTASPLSNLSHPQVIRHHHFSNHLMMMTEGFSGINRREKGEGCVAMP
jgi:hypothetical protein